MIVVGLVVGLVVLFALIGLPLSVKIIKEY